MRLSRISIGLGLEPKRLDKGFAQLTMIRLSNIETDYLQLQQRFCVGKETVQGCSATLAVEKSIALTQPGLASVSGLSQTRDRKSRFGQACRLCALSMYYWACFFEFIEPSILDLQNGVEVYHRS